MEKTFTANRISKKGNILFPDELIIDTDEECVTFRKYKIIGCLKTKIPFSSITCVSIRKNILFADILIETKGGKEIVAEGFSHYDAERIANYF